MVKGFFIAGCETGSIERDWLIQQSLQIAKYSQVHTFYCQCLNTKSTHAHHLLRPSSYSISSVSKIERQAMVLKYVGSKSHIDSSRKPVSAVFTGLPKAVLSRS